MCNLPAEYVDIRVVTSELELNAGGDMTGFSVSYDDMPGDTRYPFQIYPVSGHESKTESTTLKAGAYHVHFRDGSDGAQLQVLVLNAPDIELAIARIKKTYPLAIISSVEQACLDAEGENPAGYLNHNDILVVHPETDSSQPIRPSRQGRPVH
jgi:hypothetical protein